MATLTIEGREVTVGDEFLRLPPEQQNATVDEIAGQLGIRGSGAVGTQAAPTQQFRCGVPIGGDGVTQPQTAMPAGLAAAGPAPQPPEPETMPGRYGGLGMNVTAGANEALYGLAGLPVDAMRGAMNLGIRGLNAATGSDIGQIPEDSFGGSRSIANAMGAIDPRLDPQNTVADGLGEQLARGVGQGVAGAVAPAGVVAGLDRAGVLGPQAMRTGEALFGRAGSARDAAIGGVSGAGAALGQEMAPDGYETAGNLAGGLAGGTLAAAGAGLFSGARSLFAPFTPGGRKRMAAGILEGGASDPAAFRRSLDNPPDPLVPGSQPTTFQATGDMGIGALERGAATRRPAEFGQRRAEQNAARLGALGRIEPEGAPETVATALRRHLDAIEADGERRVTEATDAARQRVGAAGVPMTPDAAGGDMRGAVETARAEAKRQERALWEAVDPSGAMTLGLGNTRASAREMANELSPLAQPLTEAERQIYGALDKAGEAVPLRAMLDLQSHVKATMRAERSTNGETPAYRRLSLVANGIARDFDDAVAGRVAQEAEAVQRGEMFFEETLFARYAQQRDNWFAGREQQAGVASAGASAGAYGGFGSTSIPGPSGTTSQARGGFVDTPGDPRLAGGQPDASNFDAATRQRVATFDNDTLRPFRGRPATNAPYDVPAGLLPGRIFNAGRGSFEAIGQLRAAVGPEAADRMVEGYALGDALRAAGLDDGTLDPARLAAWRRRHADALRAVPGLDARLADAGQAAEAVATAAASRRAASDAAQRGALGRIMQVDAPKDVSRIVGGMFSRQDAAAQLRRLRQAVGNDPAAARGLRRAVLDHIATRLVGNTEAGTSGLGTLKSDAFQSFTRQNRAALAEAGLSPAEIETLEAIATDMQRANRSVASVKNPGGSNTAQDQYRLAQDASPFAATVRQLLAPGGLGLGVGFANGSASGIAAGAAAAAFAAMRQAGIRTVQDLVDDALLNPERARLLLSKVPAGREDSRWQALARSFGQSAARALTGEEDNRDRAGRQWEGRRSSIEPPITMPPEHFGIFRALMARQDEDARTAVRRPPRNDRERIAELLMQRQRRTA